MLVNTTHGPLDDSALVKKEGVIDNEDERTTWIEYWLDHGHELELVHRSAHVTLKKLPVGMDGIAAALFK